MQIWLASAVASHPRVPPSIPRLWAARYCVIRYNLSGVVNRPMIGDELPQLATFVFTFLLIKARRYEHAGWANRIHCR